MQPSFILIKTKTDNPNNYCRNTFDKIINYETESDIVRNIDFKSNKCLVTFSSDYNVSKIIIQQMINLNSNLFVIKLSTNYNLKDIVISDSNLIYFGLNDNLIENLQFRNYNRDMIYSNQFEKILKIVSSTINGNPVYIDIDLNVFNEKLSPKCYRINNETSIDMDYYKLRLFLNYFSKLNVIGINIAGLDVNFTDIDIKNRIQIETIQQIYGKILNIKEKKINIYNENSRFIIFKPMEEIYINDFDEDENVDQYGWYLMRNLDGPTHDDILSKIKDGEIISIKIDIEGIEKDILISSTTMADQDLMSYYSADDYSDKRLYPDEKFDAIFNLIS